MEQTRVYSYRRFSSGRQASGHSLERQTEAARRWCQEHKLLLDESLALADLGVSAYSGDNVSRGALSGFLAAVKAGRVPIGSILLVESLDRLTRVAISLAVELLTSIVRSGIRVVSMIDGQEWNNKTINDAPSFMLSVILFARGFEESSTKAKRVSATFQSKRNAKLAVVSIMHGPGWVKPSVDRKKWIVHKNKAGAVKRVFTLASSGFGGIAIARKANNGCWPLPWRSRKNSSAKWEHTAVSRLLRDRRVLGEWQPRKVIAGKLTLDGDPVEHYFPAVIPEDLWHRVQAALSTRTGPKRMRGIKADIFSGLLYCSCGKRMERKATSGRGITRYYCIDRIGGTTKCPSLPERVLLGPVLAGIAQLEQEAFNPDLTAEHARAQIATAQAQSDTAQTRADRIMAAIEEAGASPMLLQRLSILQKEKDVADASAARGKEILEAIPLRDAKFGRDLAEDSAAIVADRNAIESRHKLAMSLFQVVKRIVWHGEYAMVHTRSGPAIGINPPNYLLERAKRRTKIS